MSRRHWRQSVVRVRAALVPNEYGTPDRDWTTPDLLPIRRCIVLPASPQADVENDATREAARDEWNLLGPVLADIDKGDRIVYRTHTYEVVGFPAQWMLGARLDHVQVRLARVEG